MVIWVVDLRDQRPRLAGGLGSGWFNWLGWGLFGLGLDVIGMGLGGLDPKIGKVWAKV